MRTHPALARRLGETPEQQLADLADPDTLTLVIACAGASYKVGSSYLHALQARRDAARIGSPTGIIRWTRVVSACRAMVQADAEGVPVGPLAAPGPLPSGEAAGDLDRAGGAMLNRAGLIGAVAVAALAAGAWWLAFPNHSEQRAEPLESGSEQARLQPPPQAEKPRVERPSQTASEQDSAELAAVPAPDTEIPVYSGKNGIGADDEGAGPAPARTEPPSTSTMAAAIAPEPAASTVSASPERQVALFVPPVGAPLPGEPPGELTGSGLPVSQASASTPSDAPPVPAEQALAGRASQDGAESAALPELLTARAELQTASTVPQASPAAPLNESQVAALLSDAPVPHGNNRAPANTSPVLAAGQDGQAPIAQTGTSPEQGSEVRTVRGEAVRLRRKPGLSATILGVLSAGDEVNVNRTKGGWSHVVAKDGRSGWMASEHLTDARSMGLTQTAGKEPGSDVPAVGAHPAASQPSDPADPATTGASRPAEPSSPAFIVDTVAPEAPEFLGFSPDTGAAADGRTNAIELVLTGRAEADSTVTVRDGGAVLGTAPADASGAWSFGTEVLTEGPHSFTASATDVAGNTGAPSGGIAVTVDTTAPPVALLAVKNDVTGENIAPTGLTNDNTPTLSGTAEEGSTVEVILSKPGSPDIVLTPAPRGADWSVTPGAALTDGPYTLRVKAVDTAGNATEVGAGQLK